MLTWPKPSGDFTKQAIQRKPVTRRRKRAISDCEGACVEEEVPLDQTSHITDIEPDKEYEFKLVLYDGDVIVQSLESPVILGVTGSIVAANNNIFDSMYCEETGVSASCIFADTGVSIGVIVGGVIACIIVILIVVLLAILGRKFYPSIRGITSYCFKLQRLLKDMWYIISRLILFFSDKKEQKQAKVT